MNRHRCTQQWYTLFAVEKSVWQYANVLSSADRYNLYAERTLKAMSSRPWSSKVEVMFNEVSIPKHHLCWTTKTGVRRAAKFLVNSCVGGRCLLLFSSRAKYNSVELFLTLVRESKSKYFNIRDKNYEEMWRM